MDGPLGRSLTRLAPSLLAAVALTGVVASVAGGVASAALPPDEISFPATNGAVRFTHRNHFTRHVDGCRTCHAPQGRYMRQLPHLYGKTAAHEFCLGCHRQREPAPMRCSQCHDPGAGRAPALVPPGEEGAPASAVAPEPWPPRLEPTQVLRDPAAETARPAPNAATAPSAPPAATAPPAPAAPATASASPTASSPAPAERPAPPASAPASPTPTAAAAAPATASPGAGPTRTPPPPYDSMPSAADSEMKLIREIEAAEARAREAEERARRSAP
jgi:hypothetical protein